MLGSIHSNLMDLVVHLGSKTYGFGLGIHGNWLIRKNFSAGGVKEAGEETFSQYSLYRDLRSFLEKWTKQFEYPVKIVVVSDAAERFLSSLKNTPKKIGYLRIATDSYQPEYMLQLLEKNGGKLLIKHFRPDDLPERQQCREILENFSAAGVTDIAVSSAYQFGSIEEDRRFIEKCKNILPGRFVYHQLENREYSSFLLRENRLLINVLIGGLLSRELEVIQRACRDIGISSPLAILEGSGYCIDYDTALKDPLAVWQGSYAAAMMGASLWFNTPDAIVLTPRFETTEEGKKVNLVMLDRIRDFKPVTGGRTKSFFGLQVAGPFPGAVQLPLFPHRHRLLEAIHSINSSRGSLPIIDLTHENFNLQDLEYPIYKAHDFNSVLLTGARAAEFRKYFHRILQPGEIRSEVQEKLRNFAHRDLQERGFERPEMEEEFSVAASRYIKTETEMVTLRISSRF